MSKIDEIKARMNKKAQNTKEKSRREWQEFLDHPLLYSALIVSGALSALAGASIGIGLHVTDGQLYIKWDVPHLFFAGLYSVLFPYFFEYGLANWLNKYLKREPDNRIQNYTSIVMVVFTFVGTTVTAFSAMDVLITSLGFFDAFQEIPPTVQKWIAFSLPGMLMLNIAAGELYRQFSAASILRREIEMDLREKKIEADNEVQIAQMEAEKAVAIAAAQEYSRRAIEETPNIGKNKGGEMWNHDKTRQQVSYASETRGNKMDEQDDHKQENPTKASPQR